MENSSPWTTFTIGPLNEPLGWTENKCVICNAQTGGISYTYKDLRIK